jgi:hypothetical protein
MTFLVPLTLFGWIPAVIYLFMVLPPRRAVIAAFLIAWLFLPMAGYKVAALPDYTKMSATVFGVVLAASLFDPNRFLRFRPRWVDIPAAIFCLSPLVTSVVNEINGSGVYDGLSTSLTMIVTWGLPYLIGRAYFDDIESLKELAIGIFIGGIIYMPLCWIEMRLSPQLHNWFYGFHQHDFRQTLRLGGYRPMVFMQHGLMVGMWMAMCALIGVWLLRSWTIRKLFDMPLNVLVPLLLLTAIGVRSMYAAGLLALGLFALYTALWFRTKWIIAVLLLIPPAFIAVRSTATVDGLYAVKLANETFGAERGGSFETRVVAENALSAKAREKPWFGWGGWNNNRVVEEETGNYYITDSLWIITFGTAGMINLAALTIMLLLPMMLILKDYRVELWSHPMIAPSVVLAMISMLYMFDHLLNAMVNPIFMLAVGGVCSAHFNLPRRLPVPELYLAVQQRAAAAASAAPAMRQPQPMRRPG